jgi:hypothetical protein
MGDPDDSVDGTSHNDVNVQDGEGIMLTDSGDNYQATGLSPCHARGTRTLKAFSFSGSITLAICIGPI